ncbi:thioesterase family protein [Halobacillus massiliensis]|uniref:thioesterase family protein n=1 Tax=Halobacillus massiliensis TaxID=1926286 RepID=UPI0009E5A3E6|nr:thioesterase family protein [Halobacillus massiliensis]
MTYSFNRTVPSEWVDYNGHMNDAEYNHAFSLATDAFIDYIGLSEEARKKWNYTIFTLETHTCYLQEMKEGEEFEVTPQLLDYDSKRIHLFLKMKNKQGETTATLEELLMGIDQKQGRGAPFPQEVADTVTDFYKTQANLEIPKQAGRTIGIRRK